MVKSQAYEVVVQCHDGLARRIHELADRFFKGKVVCKGIIDGSTFVEFLNLEAAINFDFELLAEGYDSQLRLSPYGGAHDSCLYDSFR